ncbi:probable inactive purple acid phosphatase 29 isoform X2 [Glycine max]|uniref:probable inactive purple acid phosphatase 29 isoform X2 n=1 Tax=Glycine max TaxID=3847 RepID=UPI001B3577EE|nr:probable inactive purple acid phosphatase 29 isoform X2 [Glycine max]
MPREMFLFQDFIIFPLMHSMVNFLEFGYDPCFMVLCIGYLHVHREKTSKMELFIISGAACLPHPSKKAYISKPVPQKDTAPGLAYFHIPLPEYATFDSSNMSGVKQEPDGNGISSPSVNSGFFTTLLAAGDVKAVFTGHDHINDFCGNLMNIQLCYGGGFGYHAYGKAGWPRRARVVVASLEKTGKGSWGDVKSIKTWKRLDDQHLTGIDDEVLWSKSTGVAGTRDGTIEIAPK